jgi:hypothetical protein
MVEDRFDINPPRSGHQPDEDPPEAQLVSDALRGEIPAPLPARIAIQNV